MVNKPLGVYDREAGAYLCTSCILKVCEWWLPHAIERQVRCGDVQRMWEWFEEEDRFGVVVSIPDTIRWCASCGKAIE